MSIDIGNVNLTGSHFSTGAGAVTISIAGLQPKTQYGQISVGDTADLSRSRLNVKLENQFGPQPGQRFDIIVTSKLIKGDFLTKSFPTWPGIVWKTSVVQQQTWQIYVLQTVAG